MLAAGALGLVGAATGAFAGVGTAEAAVTASPLSPGQLIRAAMHVHASCSEGAASWETQFAQAASLVDVLYLTDHDFRALAFNYLPSLTGIALMATSTGSLAQKVTTNTDGVRPDRRREQRLGGRVRHLRDPGTPTAWNRLRTYIAGHSLVVTFPSARVDAGGTYEIVVQLSNHPAFGTRPAGQFYLRYRFGAFASARFVDATGLTGVVTRPTPAAGSKVTFDITADVAALWPDMLAAAQLLRDAVDGGYKPAQGCRRRRLDERASSCVRRTTRPRSSRRRSRCSRPTGRATRGSRRTRPSRSAGWSRTRSRSASRSSGRTRRTITNANHDSAYNAIAASVRAQGGLVSWNHPFGFWPGRCCRPRSRSRTGARCSPR